ncbi:hypothetical protein CWB99_20770 [Pseudoalteromonas rubra]|uniref:CHAD domain-containing protein n=2 Tax=Pseudoalteromonas rubra TaxID=43658 RepID=A0A5S3WHF6_9GAMM|nr:hypothetical protein CWB99_20770 [Pseudoalteromonas rubra]TMP30983.1 hypothetical protein CWC00_15365 [Pseudoalteromonas rubra]
MSWLTEYCKPASVIWISDMNLSPVPASSLRFNPDKGKPLHVFTDALLGCLAIAEQNRRVFLCSHDPEAVHQYRIVLRQARSLIKVHSDWLTKPVRHQLTLCIKQLTRPTDIPRDFQVLGEQIAQMPVTERFCPALASALNEVSREVNRLRYSQCVRLRRYWHSRDYQHQFAAAEAKIKEVHFSIKRKTYRSTLRQIAVRQLNKLKKRIKHLPELDLIHQHRVRIRVKVLRYVVSLYRPWLRRIKLKPLRKSQKNLGKLHDLETHSELLQSYLARKHETTANYSLCALGVGALIQQWARHYERTLTSLSAQKQI